LITPLREVYSRRRPHLTASEIPIMHKPILALAFLVPLAFLPLAGCYTTQKDHQINLFTGENMQKFSGTPDQVIAAASEVSKDMKWTVVNMQADKTTGHLTATTSTEKIIEFTAASIGDRVTELTVRIGTGDKKMSAEIFDKIRAKL
jgi:hypothetical protein